MKIAVTGGSGFIGAATVANAYARGHDAWSFDRSDGNDVMGDLAALRGADAVIHLAGVLGTAELFDTAEEAARINVVGSTRIMQWCIDNDAAYVGILMPNVFPSIYTATKMATYNISEAFRRAGKLRVAHVRAFNAYGPGQKFGPGHPQKIVPTFAVKAWRREPLPIWGSGQQGVDLIHSDDLGRMLVDAVELVQKFYEHRPDGKKRMNPHNGLVLDGGSGVCQSVLDVALHIIRFAGWESGDSNCIETFRMRDGEVETQIKAEGQGWEWLNWRPRHDMELLRETVEYYRRYA